MSFRAFGQCVIVDSPFNKNKKMYKYYRYFLRLTAITLEERYYPLEGEFTFRVWTFAGDCLLLSEHKRQFNLDKGQNLLTKMKSFLDSPISAEATEDQRKDLQELIKKLTILCESCQTHKV